MSRVSKFLENELDRISDYLAMAQAKLEVPAELCETNCERITPVLTEKDEKVIGYLTKELSLLEAKINDAKDIIDRFKDYYFELEDLIESNKD